MKDVLSYQAMSDPNPISECRQDPPMEGIERLMRALHSPPMEILYVTPTRWTVAEFQAACAFLADDIRTHEQARERIGEQTEVFDGIKFFWLNKEKVGELMSLAHDWGWRA